MQSPDPHRGVSRPPNVTAARPARFTDRQGGRDTPVAATRPGPDEGAIGCQSVPSHPPIPGRGALRRLRRGGVSALSAAALSVSAVTGLVALAPAAGASTGDEYGFLAHLTACALGTAWAR